MPGRILLVDVDPPSSKTVADLFTQVGHLVTWATSFEAASQMALQSTPDLVITAVRLGRFNGLHLAARFRADYPNLPIVVLGDAAEVSLAAEAMQHGARFVPRSTEPQQFLNFVDALLTGGAPKDLVSTRRWVRHTTSLAATAAGICVRVVDVGYGGMRLECAIPPAADRPIDVGLHESKIAVEMLFRWAKPSPAGSHWQCGFELGRGTTATRQAWRRFVDSV